jgi:hypothetical protein
VCEGAGAEAADGVIETSMDISKLVVGNHFATFVLLVRAIFGQD